MKKQRPLTPDEQARYDAAMEQFEVAAKVLDFNGDIEPLQRALDMLHSIPAYKPTRWQRLRMRVRSAVRTRVEVWWMFYLRPDALKVRLLRAYLKAVGKL